MLRSTGDAVVGGNPVHEGGGKEQRFPAEGAGQLLELVVGVIGAAQGDQRGGFPELRENLLRQRNWYPGRTKAALRLSLIHISEPTRP